MESKKKTPKLLFQITALVIPLFILMTVSVALTVYNSTVNGFLEAKNNHIEQLLSDRYNYFMFIGDNNDPRVQQWFIEQAKKADFDYDRDLTNEELSVYIEYQSRENSFEYSWYEEMPDNIRKLFLQQYFYAARSDISDTLSESGDIESLFLMELTPDGHGVILFDNNINGNSIKMGTRLDDDFSQHPVWKETAESDDKTIRFEKTSDFPCPGNYYIGYKPVLVNGDAKAVIGVSYNWDGFRDDLTGTITKALLIIVGGIAAVLTVLLLFLYRKVISPTARMHKAVLRYTDDKDSAKIVDEMYKVSVKNELGYLSDAISDLALEIDLYTKENIRIAGEKERAEKELYQAEVQIMVSQIRPHFMYNALSSIAILCKLDPPTAYEATIAFSKYLRGNMDSLKRTRYGNYSPAVSVTTLSRDIEKLKATLSSMVSGYPGTWSVCVKNLRTGETLTVNDRQYYAASLMKLWCMAATYEAIEEGRVKESECTALLTQMITVSSDDAFNRLVYKIGKTAVRDWIIRNGYTNTVQRHGYGAGYGYAGLKLSEGSNLTTVTDCVKFFESVYRGECVSKAASAKMLALLKQQYWTYKLPQGVPSGVVTANKTGEVRSNSHDCMLVFLNGDPYIMSVMTEYRNSALANTGRIRQLSRTVYNFFAYGNL